MVYTQEGVIKDSRPWAKMFVAGAAAVTLAVGMFVAVSATHNSTGCTFDDTTTPGTWSLTADCTTTATIDVPSDTILEGNDFKISASPTVTGQVLGVTNADNVTINNLTVEGAAGVSLRGVNVYQSENVALNDVTILNNDKHGLVVNGSEVTVDNLTTSGNGWGGVNVDLGSGVTSPAILTVTGNSTQSESVNIYVDDITKNVSVVDVNNQYLVSSPISANPNDRLYTLKSEVSTNKDACKNGGYGNLVSATGVGFKNQGQCVAAAVANSNASFKREQ
jgi:hypothetical protein